jgi:hypothetical protein
MSLEKESRRVGLCQSLQVDLDVLQSIWLNVMAESYLIHLYDAVLNNLFLNWACYNMMLQ